MLKGIDPIISPELLKVLCEMGHGDVLVLADGNFPTESVGKDAIVVRCDGHGTSELLKAILKLMPLDQYTSKPVTLMEVVPGDSCETPIWKDYEDIISSFDKRGANIIGTLERFAFYDEAKNAYCVVATGERAQYANIMLRKGVVFAGE
ncbi:RbsD/FucU family protein [Gardnerella vaginalis]|uniref:RbsD/FucU family protein n=1 Tax=Gardnerella vaginalis TaxID=2702 RepID=UPI0039EE32B5